jgi:proteasome lid subunit RPN8/RPN11
MRLAIPQRMADDLLALAERESPREVVGILAARLDDLERVTTMAPLPNHSPTPTEAFFVEPWKQYQVEVELAAKGYKVVGYYHSHPKGGADPSGPDADRLKSDCVMVIISLAEQRMRAWKRNNDRPVSEEVVIFYYRDPTEVAA